MISSIVPFVHWKHDPFYSTLHSSLNCYVTSNPLGALEHRIQWKWRLYLPVRRRVHTFIGRSQSYRPRVLGNHTNRIQLTIVFFGLAALTVEHLLVYRAGGASPTRCQFFGAIHFDSPLLVHLPRAADGRRRVIADNTGLPFVSSFPTRSHDRYGAHTTYPPLSRISLPSV
jgi:hypothetical protein